MTEVAGSTPILSSELGTVYTEEQIQSVVDKYAKQYGVSSTKMMEVIKCESGVYDYKTKEVVYRNIQSLHTKNGIREDSWGIVQIYLPAHPTVSRQEALDPIFSVEFMAKKFSVGWTKWTCYK